MEVPENIYIYQIFDKLVGRLWMNGIWLHFIESMILSPKLFRNRYGDVYHQDVRGAEISSGIVLS